MNWYMVALLSTLAVAVASGIVGWCVWLQYSDDKKDWRDEI